MVKSRLDPPPPPPDLNGTERYVLYFQDNGQDFLRWYLDADGRVTRSEPFQTWLWRDYVVVNLRKLRIWADNDANHPGVHERPCAYVCQWGASITADPVPIIHPVIKFEVR